MQQILTKAQAEKAYNAMCALNNVGGRIDIRLAPGLILVSETETGNVLINSWELGDESHSDREAFATAYGLQCTAHSQDELGRVRNLPDNT